MTVHDSQIATVSHFQLVSKRNGISKCLGSVEILRVYLLRDLLSQTFEITPQRGDRSLIIFLKHLRQQKSILKAKVVEVAGTTNFGLHQGKGFKFTNTILFSLVQYS